MSLLSWGIIVHTNAGLKRKIAKDVEAPQVATPAEGFLTEQQSEASRSTGLLASFACPPSLRIPVILATLSQFNYWTLGNNSYIIASQMLNHPGNCNGAWGASALRIASTVNFWSVPIGSVCSSFRRCPRPMFNFLFLVQFLCAILLCLCLFGVGRESFWTTELGRCTYIAAYGMVGMLEGYLLTMGYRYCGDDENVPVGLKDSSSKLLGIAGILVVNIPNIFIGILETNGAIACH